MYRRLAPTLMILMSVILDTTLLPMLYGGVFAVSLTLVSVLMIGMLLGRTPGLVAGTLGGLLLDITTGTLGIMTFYFLAAGFLIGLILYTPGERIATTRRYVRRQWMQRAIWVFVLTAIGEIVLLGIQYISTVTLQARYFVNIALRSLIVTVLCMLLYPACRKWLLGGRNSNTTARNREVKQF